jgi:hypothetical protein
VKGTKTAMALAVGVLLRGVSTIPASATGSDPSVSPAELGDFELMASDPAASRIVLQRAGGVLQTYRLGDVVSANFVLRSILPGLVVLAPLQPTVDTREVWLPTDSGGRARSEAMVVRDAPSGGGRKPAAAARHVPATASPADETVRRRMREESRSTESSDQPSPQGPPNQIGESE